MFEEALTESAIRLDGLKAQGVLQDYALIGAMALARVAVPRATADIDYAVKFGVTPEELAQSVGGVARIGDLSDPLVSSVSFYVTSKNGAVPVQLVQFPLTWENVAFSALEYQNINGRALPFASSKSLLLLKLYAGSPLDMQDAAHIVHQGAFSANDMAELKKQASTLRLSKRLARLLKAVSEAE